MSMAVAGMACHNGGVKARLVAVEVFYDRLWSSGCMAAGSSDSNFN